MSQENITAGATNGGTTIATPGGQAGTSEARSYTQAELDKLFAPRNAEAAERAVKGLLASVGVEKPEDLKVIADELKRLKDAQKTDAEKQTERFKALEEERDAANKAKEHALSEARKKLMRADVMREAQQQDIEPTEYASVWMALQADKSLLENIKAKGDDEFEGVDEAVKAIIAAHPKWKRSPATDGKGTPRAGIKTHVGEEIQDKEAVQQRIARHYRNIF